MSVFKKGSLFNNILGDRDGRRAVPTVSSLQDSAENLIHKVNVYKKGYWKKFVNQDIEARLAACAELQYRQASANMDRDYDDAIFRAYHAEGGIRGKLEKLLNYVDVQLEDAEDISTVHTIAFNGMIDMAAYLLRKLVGELDGIKSREVARTDKRDDFKRSINWNFVMMKGTRLTDELKDILNRLDEIRPYRDDTDGELMEIDRRVKLLSTEAEELEAEMEKNLARIGEIETAYRKSPSSYSIQNQGLYDSLRDYLSEERLAPLSKADGTALEEYKRELTAYADGVQAAVLDKWRQPK